MAGLLFSFKKLFDGKGRKFICTPHGPFMARRNYSLSEKILRRIWIGFQRIYSNRLYDKVIAVNPNQVEWINKEYGINRAKITFLPIGINQKHFTKSDPKILLERYPQLNGKVIITYLGRFHQYKGVLDLIKAFKKMTEYNLENSEKVHLVMMGSDAGALEQMQKLITKYKLEEEITILTNPTDSERDLVLDLSEIFVFPSEWEAYGIAMLEAMAHGNAVISTKTEGGIHLIGEENGILYNFSDINKTSESINHLLENEEFRQNLIENNIEKAQSLKWGNIWPEYKKIYDRQ